MGGRGITLVKFVIDNKYNILYNQYIQETMMRSQAIQDKLDVMFYLKYGRDFSIKNKFDVEVERALFQHYCDIQDQYIQPRISESLNNSDYLEQHNVGEDNLLLGYTYTSNNNEATIKQIDLIIWGSNNTSEKIDDVILLGTMIKMKEQLREGNNEYELGPMFIIYNRKEADRYVRFMNKVFNNEFNYDDVVNDRLQHFE